MIFKGLIRGDRRSAHPVAALAEVVNLVGGDGDNDFCVHGESPKSTKLLRPPGYAAREQHADLWSFLRTRQSGGLVLSGLAFWFPGRYFVIGWFPFCIPLSPWRGGWFVSCHNSNVVS